MNRYKASMDKIVLSDEMKAKVMNAALSHKKKQKENNIPAHPVWKPCGVCAFISMSCAGFKKSSFWRAERSAGGVCADRAAGAADIQRANGGEG